jgi:UDP-N-acetylmuramoyl-L-alanyl-D-glutamate--2,6-diaminopimelate ligase
VTPAQTRGAATLAVETAEWLRGTLAAGATLRSDSRDVEHGDAFFAYPGQHGDGRRHIGQAVERGAAAVVWERDGFGWPQGLALPNRPVPGLKALCGPVASRFLGEPTADLRVVAVTGTNGKTSCTQWIAQGLQRSGREAAVVGTLGAGRPGHLKEFGLTTPDALALQHLFAALAADGVSDVAIEASSIGLDQHRLDGSRIAVAVHTNVTRDHLDHHGTIQAYANAKARLFGWPALAAAVVNLDDAWSHAMLEAVASDTLRIGYRIADRPTAAETGGSPACHLAAGQVDRMLVATSVETAARGMRVEVDGDYGRATLSTPLIGRFNVANLLAVAGAWLAVGSSFEDAIARLGELEPVPGRLQSVSSGAGEPLAVVDYAHSPDALANALAALRPLAAARGGRLWCVFGAGGERDPGKRPLMGAVVERHADVVVLTSDNPRGEPPDAILAAIGAGMDGPPWRRDPDRARAIATAVAAAGDADVVLIAGKGHEAYQDVGGVRLPFSDVGHAAQALARRAAARGAGAADA